MTPLLEKNLLPTKVASDISGYTPDYLARLCRSGKIRGEQIGRSWLIERASLEQFIAEQSNRNIDRARALARAREKEYAVASTMAAASASGKRVPHKITRILQAQVPTIPKRWRNEGLAIAAAVLVVCFGAGVAQAQFATSLGANALATLDTAAEGMRDIAKNAGDAALARIAFVSSSAQDTRTAVAEKIARATNDASSATIGTGGVAGVQLALAAAAPTAQEESPVSVAPVATTSAPMRTFALSPSLAISSATSVANAVLHPYDAVVALVDGTVYAYLAAGTLSYHAILASLNLYSQGITNAGQGALALATSARDADVAMPGEVEGVQIAIGNAVIAATHASIADYVDGIDAWTTVTPEVPPLAAHGAIALGDTLGNASANVLPAAAAAYEHGVYAFADGSQRALAQTIALEKPVATAWINGSLAILGADSSLTSGAGNLAYETFSRTSQALGMSSSAITNAPAATQDMALGTEGKTAVALESAANETASTSAALIAGVSRNQNQLLASASASLTTGERTALFTYEAISGLWSDAQLALANIFAPLPGVVTPVIVHTPQRPALATAYPYTPSAPATTIIQNIQNVTNNVTPATQVFVHTSDGSVVDSLGSSFLVDLTAALAPMNLALQFSGTSVTLPGSLTIGNSLNVNGTTTLATTTITGDFATTGTTTTTNLLSTNATSTNLFVTNATTTNLFAANSIFTNATTTNAIIGTSTTTNAFATNLVATNATSTNLFGTNSTFANSTTTNAYVNSFIALAASTTNFFSTNSVFGNASSTNLFATNSNFTNASSTNLFASLFHATSGAIDTFSSTLATITGLNATNSTTTNATTTDAYAANSVTGNATTTDLAVSGFVYSNLIPGQNNAYDLGSPGNYWRDGYLNTLNVNTLSAGSTTISGTGSNNFTINTDNATNDSEDMSLVFFRGTATPNAVLAWNSLTKRFEFNEPIYSANGTFDNATSTNAFDTNLVATNATSTNGFATNFNATNATSTNLFATNAVFTNASLSSLALSGFTQGSVPFIGASGQLTQNNSNLFWDNVNARLGVGTTTPLVSLSVGGSDALRLPVGNTSQRPLAGNTQVGDVRYNTTTHQFEGYGDNAVWQGLGGVINAAQTTFITAGTDDFLRFVTASKERMTISNTGLIGFGSTTPSARLSLAGFAADATDLFDISTSTVSATTTALRVDSNGNLSLLNGASLSVGGSLTVTGTTSFTGGISAGVGNNTLVATNGSGVLVGTSTPSAASYLATSTTATSTFLGGFLAGTNAAFAVNAAAAANSLYISASGSIGVGTNAPNASALLDLTSTTGGLLVPRLTTTQKNAIAAPSAGLVLYDTTLNKLNVYNGTAWKNVGSTEIGGEVTSGTVGSVLFIGSNGNLAQDNTNFNYSTTTDELTTPNIIDSGVATNNLVYSNGSHQLAAVTLGSGLAFSGGTLSAATSSLAGTFFAQGGNAFGAPAVLGTTDTNDLQFITNGSTRLDIASSTGNIGIGTTNPGSMLSLNYGFGGTAPLTITQTGISTPVFGVSNTGLLTASPSTAVSGGNLFSFGNGSGQVFSGGVAFDINPATVDSTSYIFAAQVGGNTKFVIDHAGNVGIGSSTPSQLLSVAGNAYIGGNLTATGTVTIGSLNGAVTASSGVLSAGTLGVNNGGTGQTNFTSNAILLGNGTGAIATTSAGTNGQVLALVGGVPTWQATTTLSSISGILSPANGGTGVANSNSNTITIAGPISTAGAFTTSGAFGLTLTQTAATNVTLPTSGTLYGTLANSITSAQLASSVTDETGNGALVFANSPVFTTPTLGAAIGTSLALGGATLGGNAFAVTGSTNLGGATTIGGALTYGGVTLSNSVTGTGSMVLSASPTFTGVLTTPALTLSSFSTGSILFAASGGVVSQDNSNFFYDSVNHRLGLGTTTPPGPLAIQTSVNQTKAFSITNSVGTTTLQADTLDTSGNLFSVATSTGIDYLDITSGGNVGVGTTTPTARFAVTGTGLTTGVNFQTANSNNFPLLTGLDNGNFGIGTTTPGTALSVAGTGTFSNLIDTGVAANSLLYNNGSQQLTATTIGTGLTFSGGTLAVATSTLAGSFFAQGGNSFGAAATLGTNDTNSLAFITNGIPRLTIASSSGAIGIGTSTPNASALLDLTSTTGGLLVPRVTTTQKNAIATPAAGLVLYDSTLNKLNVYNGTAWKNVGSTEIGGSVTSGIAGSVLFVGGDGNLTQDNTNFNYSTTTAILTAPNIIDTGIAANNLVYSNGSQELATTTIGNALTFSGGTLAVSTSTLASTFFAQNGNSFGATATLGTNDNNNLSFKTNGTVQATLTTAGALGLGTTSPAGGLDLNNGTGTAGGINIWNQTGLSYQLGRLGYVNGSVNVLTLSTATGIGGNNQDIQIKPGSSSGIYVNASGQTGIGYTSGMDTTVGTALNVAGRIGVGTSSPQSMVDIAASGRNTGNSAYGLRIVNTDTGSQATNIGFVTGSAVNWAIGTDYQANNTGNFYIGTSTNGFTPGTLNGPTGTVPFSINNEGTIGLLNFGSSPVTTSKRIYEQAGNLYFDGTQLNGSGITNYFTRSAGVISPATVTDKLTIGTSTATTAQLTLSSAAQVGTIPLLTIASSTTSTLLTVLGNGNVGIGTTTPDAALSINSATALTVTRTGVAGEGDIVMGSGGEFRFENAAHLRAVQVNSDGNFYINPNAGTTGSITTATLSVLQNGRLGIDTTPYPWASPFTTTVDFGAYGGLSSLSGGVDVGYNFYYNGSAYIAKNTGYVQLFRAGGNQYQWYGTPGSITAGTSASTLTEVMVLDTTNGNLSINGAYSPSDARLKTNVQPLGSQNGLAIINELSPVNFDWIDQSRGTGTQAGFIAQQVQQILPNLVTNSGIISSSTPDGELTLNYAGFAPYIVSAVQQLSAQVNALAGSGSATTTNITFLNATTTTTDTLCLSGDCRSAWPSVASSSAPDLSGYALLSDIPDVSSFVSSSTLATAIGSVTTPNLSSYAKLSDLSALSSTFVSTTTLANALANIPSAALSGTQTGNIVPDTDNTYNVGSATHRLANVYAANVNAGDLTYAETTNNTQPAASGLPAYTFQQGDMVALFVNSTSGGTHTVPVDIGTAISNARYGSNNIFFNTTGDVGVGIATTTTPKGKLDVEANIASGDTRLLTLANTGATGALPYSFYVPSTGDLNIASNDNSNGSSLNASRPSWDVKIGGATDSFSINRSAAAASTTYSNLLAVTSTGNVGIGTTSPSGLLNAYSTTVNNPMLVLTDTNTTSNASVPLFLASKSGGSMTNVSIENEGAGNLMFRTGATTETGFGTAQMIISSTGNVGIGTTTPLDNSDSIFSHNLTLSAGGGLGTVPGFLFDGNQGAGSGVLGDIGFYSGGTRLGDIAYRKQAGIGSEFQFITSSNGTTEDTGAVTITGPGNLQLAGCLSYNGGTSGTCLSDERVKQDITPVVDGLAQVAQLNPVTYQYNGLAGTTADGVTRYGLIAQQVQAVAPDLITTVYQKLNPTDATTTALLEVNYAAVDSLLINSVKQLNTEVNALAGQGTSTIQNLVAINATTTTTDNLTATNATVGELCLGGVCQSAWPTAASSSAPDLSSYALLTDVPDVSNFVTSSQLSSAIASSTPDLSSFVKTSQLASAMASIPSGPLAGTATGSIIPDTDATYSLGSPAARFSDIYAQNVHAGDLTYAETTNNTQPAASGLPAYTFQQGDMVALFVNSTSGGTHTVPVDIGTAISNARYGSNNIFLNTTGDVSVGIATTTTPRAKLDVEGNIASGDTRLLTLANTGATGAIPYSFYVPSSGDLNIASNDNSNGSSINASRPSWDVKLGGATDAFSINRSAAAASTTYSNLLTVTSAGNVGISTTTPFARLSVDTTSLGSAPAFIVGSSTAASLIVNSNGRVGIGSAIDIGSGAAIANPLYIAGAQGYASSASNLATAETKAAVVIQGGNDASGRLDFGAEHTNDNMYIQGTNFNGSGSGPILLNPYGGAVVVGAAAPNTTITGGHGPDLDIEGDGSTDDTMLTLNSNTTSGSGSGIRFGNQGSTNTWIGNGTFAISGFGLSDFGLASGGNIGLDSASGSVYIESGAGTCTYSGGSSISCSSDERLKENVAAIAPADALEQIDQLQPVTYDLKLNPSNGTQLGFLAQDVQKIFPEAVTFNAISTTTYTPNGEYELNYTALIAPAIAAIQQLDAKVNALAGSGTATSTNLSYVNVTATTTTTDTLCLSGDCRSSWPAATSSSAPDLSGYALLTNIPDVSSFVSTSTFASNLSNYITSSQLASALAGVSTSSLNSLAGTQIGNIIPDTDNTYNVGSPTNRLANIYAANVNAGDLTYAETTNNTQPAASGLPAYTFQQGDMVALFVNSTSGGTHTVPVDIGTAISNARYGSNNIFFNTTGKVSIGIATTTTPKGKLDVEANIASGDTRLLTIANTGATGALPYSFYVPSSGDLNIASNDNSNGSTVNVSYPSWDLKVGGATDAFSINRSAAAASTTYSNLLSITNGGFVGIATATPAYPLSVAGTIYSSSGGFKFPDGSIQTSAASGASSVPSGTTGQFPYYAANGTVLTATSSLSISTTGNIGIGTTTPNSQLEIAVPHGVGAPGSSALEMVDAANPSYGFDLTLETSATGDLSLRRIVAGTPTPIINFVRGTGDVLINEATASQTGGGRGHLGINGTSGGMIAFDTAGSNTADVYTSGTNLLASSVSGSVYLSAGGGNCIYSGGSSFSCSSDERLKGNVTPLSSGQGLAAIDQLKPVTYILNGNASLGTQLGFLAQDVQQVFPQAVTFDPTIVSSSTPNGSYLLNYTALIPPAIAVIQQLDARTNFITNGATSSTTQALTVDASGNVGIKTSVPTNALSVGGDIGASGNVYANGFVAPSTMFASVAAAVGFATSTAPSAVLTADGTGVDLYKLAVYNLGSVASLAVQLAGESTRMDSLEARIAKLENGAIAMSTSTPFSTSTITDAFNSFGAFIEDGIAQFGTLVADRFVAATDSSGASSAGSGTILQGNTVVEIANANVSSTSKIFVTFTNPISGSWYLSNKQAGSFRVSLENPQGSDVSFDYFIVETQGQIATSTPSTSSSSNPNWFPLTPDPNAGNSGSSTGPTTGSSTGTSTPPVTGGDDSASSTPSGSGDASSTPSDTNPPTITLTGAAAIQLTVGDSFTDPGATAADSVDGNLTSSITETGSVDTSTAGIYTLTYNVSDAAGNEAHVSRVVTVVAAPTGGDASSTPPTP